MKKLLFPLILSLSLLAVYGSLRLTSPAWIGEAGYKYLLAGIMVTASIVLVRTINFVLFDVIFEKRKGRVAPSLLRIPVSIIGYSALGALIYNLVLDKDLTALLTTSAVVTVILGLALQDTLGNFFAGLSLHIEQPYYIGDAIKVGEALGRVEGVTWRTTAIRTNNNSIIIFPNSRVAREPLEVFPLSTLNRRVLRFPVPYAVYPERIIPIVRDSVASIAGVASEKQPTVRISDFSDSSVTYEVLYWVRDYMTVQNIDAEIRERVWYLYRRQDIDIPFPIRHVMMEPLERRAATEVTDYGPRIETVDLFEPLDSQERAAIIHGLITSVYAPGEVILRRGESGDSMFVINRGSAEVLAPAANGQPQQVAVLRPGDCFGEMALFTGEVRTADVNALEEVEILEIQKPVVEELLTKNSLLAEAFSRKIAERQATLAEYSRLAPEDRRQFQEQNILHRIRRFFQLN